MAMIEQAKLEALVLLAFYEYYQSNSGDLTIVQIGELLEIGTSPKRIELALAALIKNDFASTNYNYDNMRYEISEKGYKYAEELFLRSSEGGSEGSEGDRVPAADRLVGFDHNSSEYHELLETTADLKRQLDNSNDVGEMSVRAVAVAADETEQLDRALRTDFIRPAHVWEIAKSTLKWIGTQAAGAAVGQAALALLALIATIFGISIA